MRWAPNNSLQPWILCLTRHSEPTYNNQTDECHTSNPNLVCSVYGRVLTLQASEISILFTKMFTVVWEILIAFVNDSVADWSSDLHLLLTYYGLYIHLPHTGMILSLRPANKRRRYKVTPSLIGLAQTCNQPCHILSSTLCKHVYVYCHSVCNVIRQINMLSFTMNYHYSYRNPGMQFTINNDKIKLDKLIQWLPTAVSCLNS